MKDFNVIHASCKGPAKEHRYQDYVLVDETKTYLLACVADGVGSCELSDRGSSLICSVLLELFADPMYVDKFSDSFLQIIINTWYDKLGSKGISAKLCHTTSSFLYIDKLQQRALVGIIGDSPVYFCCNGSPVKALKSEKDFINETESLGGSHHPHYHTYQYSIDGSGEFLLATDGFGDEIMDDAIKALFEYFKSKYSQIPKEQRNVELKKEIMDSVQDKNPDDKSLIFGWYV